MHSPLGAKGAPLGLFGVSMGTALLGQMRSVRQQNSPAMEYRNGELGDYFDPNDLTRQFQDSAGTVPVASIGDPVGLVIGQLGRILLTQTTTPSRPTLRMNASGRLVWRLDGGDDHWFSASPLDLSATDKLMAFAGVTKRADNQGSFIFELSTNSAGVPGTWSLLVNGATVNGPRIGALMTGTSTVGWDGPVDFSAAVGPRSAVVSGLYDTAQPSLTTEIKLRRNGIPLQVSAATGTSAGTGKFASGQTLYVGCRAGTGYFFAGDLEGFGIRAGVVSQDSDLLAVERWVAKNMGLLQ